MREQQANPSVYITWRQVKQTHEPDIKIELESGQNVQQPTSSN